MYNYLYLQYSSEAHHCNQVMYVYAWYEYLHKYHGIKVVFIFVKKCQFQEENVTQEPNDGLIHSQHR